MVIFKYIKRAASSGYICALFQVRLNDSLNAKEAGLGEHPIMAGLDCKLDEI